MKLKELQVTQDNEYSKSKKLVPVTKAVPELIPT